jgi:hypothetical protein
VRLFACTYPVAGELIAIHPPLPLSARVTCSLGAKVLIV